MDPDSHIGDVLGIALNRYFCAVLVPGLAGANLSVNLCPQRRSDERYDGGLYDVYDQYRTTQSSSDLSRFYEHDTIPLWFHASVSRQTGRSTDLRRDILDVRGNGSIWIFDSNTAERCVL